MPKKTIIITGASSGIGRALALHLASAEHNIIAIARRRELLEELHNLYPNNIKIVVADITKANERQKIKNILTDERGIYLVNNAGIAIPKKLSLITEKEWDQHYLTNIKSAVFLTQLLIPHLKNGGRVLNISSGLAHTPCAGMAAYGVAKSALLMFKEYCNAELLEQDIAFASAMPGIVSTPIQEVLRSYDVEHFPSSKIFLGFFQRGELLNPITSAKFLAWLLLQVEKQKFINGDWNIYDTTHHAYWAEPGEVKQRQKTDEEIKKESPVQAGHFKANL